MLLCLSRVRAERGVGENGTPVPRQIGGNEKASHAPKPKDGPDERKEFIF